MQRSTSVRLRSGLRVTFCAVKDEQTKFGLAFSSLQRDVLILFVSFPFSLLISLNNPEKTRLDVRDQYTQLGTNDQSDVMLA